MRNTKELSQCETRTTGILSRRWRANCDLTTHNAQGQGSRFRGLMGDVAGVAKLQMYVRLSQYWRISATQIPA